MKTLLASLALAAATVQAAPRIVEADIATLQQQMARGAATSESLTRAYLARIQALDRNGPKTNSVLATNPDAIAIARTLDRERKAGKSRGPLHGIPVLVKDNIDTGDKMATTAGSLALANTRAERDAFVVERLRAAGAVIIGKTNLSEWANIRSGKSSSGWSALGGQVKNAYALDRNPCGSSSGTGTAIASSYATVGVGTETDGSIVCPSGMAALVGIKPTVGLVSRSGIIPISHSQDTAGPMARSVADAAALLGAMAGADLRDAATQASQGHIEADYRRFLVAGDLKGIRIGVARKKVTGYNAHTDRLFEEAIARFKLLGAEVVDPVDFGSIGDYDDDELEVLLYELKADLDTYLSQRKGLAVKSLADVIAFNDKHAGLEMRWFGQDLFIKAQAKGPLTDEAYVKAAEKSRRLAREGIDGPLKEHKLDAIIAPTGAPAWITDHVNGDAYQGASSSPAAVAGYPSITVPMGFAHGLPVGVSLFGPAWSEGQLIRIAYAYEQATKHRKAPVLVKR